MQCKSTAYKIYLAFFLLLLISLNFSHAWHGETYLAIAKAAGYYKWYSAVGADIAKIKAGDEENFNHFANNPPSAAVTPEMVLAQVNPYNDPTDDKGHLYCAIIASLRDYRSVKASGKYAEYHLAYCAHYFGGLSMSVDNIPYGVFNCQYDSATQWDSKG
jgi:hypothetical protein